MNQINLHFLVTHAKHYGFIYPSSEIYGGISSIYDYGPYGLELKKNIQKYWWKSMIQLHDNIVGLDSSILMHNAVWKASGHIEKFNDLSIDNKDSKKRYSPEILIKEFLLKTDQKNRKKFLERLNKYLLNNNLSDIESLIKELNIFDPISGSKNWTNIHLFNMMFKMNERQGGFFLRPETAQGIFTNFNNVKKSMRMKIPFGIAQVGKSFRNEIIARQFIFRMREFEQMELQFFISPKEEKKWYNYWKKLRLQWHLELNLGNNKYKMIEQNKLAHYASYGTDIKFNFPFGLKEIEGIHCRRDFDLKKHEFFSKKKFRVFKESKQDYNYIPYVIETSLGLDRILLAIYSSSLKLEKIQPPNGGSSNNRIVLKIPYYLSPIKAAIFPLVSKQGLPEIAKKIFNDIKIDYKLIYDAKSSIGKLYRRQDAIGTPICFTVDYDTIHNNTVTMRDRDTMQQKRIPIASISHILREKISMKKILKKLLYFSSNIGS
ncbi:glycine--tRNA ligase [Blattabacterium cuenoti]|uniref:glycine--tRNA ligase n=1 Tax=Blattabacterium cuenoti TaxID=1653831 RepID=UPI00163B9470|nr:glycine--tRNA ligase [Blattabacterium cuenoti]